MSKTIAVIEDEDALRELFREALEEAGYAVVGFRDGVEAFERLAVVGPDLVVLDMAMPNMDGYGVLARLRAHATLRHVPVVIISTLGEHLRQTLDPRGVKRLGVAAILHKPFPPEALIERARQILGSPRPGDGR